jgi:dsDNA-specific endonuclease/ATPase MutS2
VDLHIHELIENEEGLSRKDILDIQMKRFKDELEDAIKKKLGKIIFIHGVGNGRLKLEIWNELKKPKFKKLSYQDASFKEYGYGATLVII